MMSKTENELLEYLKENAGIAVEKLEVASDSITIYVRRTGKSLYERIIRGWYSKEFISALLVLLQENRETRTGMHPVP